MPHRKKHFLWKVHLDKTTLTRNIWEKRVHKASPTEDYYIYYILYNTGWLSIPFFSIILLGHEKNVIYSKLVNNPFKEFEDYIFHYIFLVTKKDYLFTKMPGPWSERTNNRKTLVSLFTRPDASRSLILGVSNVPCDLNPNCDMSFYLVSACILLILMTMHTQNTNAGIKRRNRSVGIMSQFRCTFF